jgi:predicted acyltransferase
MDQTLAEERAVAAAADSLPAAAPSVGRVASIDALRGFDMFWIIGGRGLFLAVLGLFVTDIPGWVQAQIDHPAWIGFSAWDMIMPLFLFVVGAVMPFSFARRIEQGHSKARLYRKIVVRSVVLFVLGIAAQGHLLDLDLSTLHIYSNTLQAIACGYFVAATLLMSVSLFWQVLVTSLLLVGYWALLVLIPVPGHGAGILDPKLNLALYIDQMILRRFQDGTTYTWILSGLGFTATVMLGAFSGELLRSKQHPWMKVLYLVLIGLGCLAVGWAWSLRFPLIKHIWTSSMVLWAGGWSFLLLALFYAVIDVIGLKRGAFPFVVIGANAIAVYMATRLIDFRHLTDPIIGGLARHLDALGGVLYRVGSGAALREVTYGQALRDVAALAVIWLILWYMYRKRTLIRI